MKTNYKNEIQKSSETRKYIEQVVTMFGEPSALELYITAGLPLFPIDPQTKCPYWRYTQQPGIKTLSSLDRNMKKYTAFATVPARGGMLAIDVDRKRGRNGIKSIQQYYEENGGDLTELRAAPFVKTPGNGIHIWFKYSGPDVLNNEPLTGVEIKHSNLVTAGGSQDHRGTYELTRSLEQAPNLPVTLRRLLVFRDQGKPWIPPQPVQDLDLETMEAILHGQGHAFTEGQRNRYIYKLALFAAKRAKPQDTTIDYCIQYEQPDFTAREITTCIKSAYKIASRGRR